MPTLRIAAAVFGAQLAVFAAQPSMLQLVMPDAKVLAGADVTQAKASTFGQYVLAHMQPDTTDAKNFIAASGFDPRRDVSELLLASDGVQGPEGHWLILAAGSFAPASIEDVARSHGATVSQFMGVDLVTNIGPARAQSSGALAFLDPAHAVLGDVASVQAAIQRSKQSGVTAPTALAQAAAQVAANNDFWFTTLVPLSQFPVPAPNQTLNSAMKGQLIQSIQQASGGVKFSSPILISGKAVMRSDKDATALEDVVKFIAGLIQTNVGAVPAGANITTLLDTMQLSTAGNVMNLSMSVPETTLEQMIDTVRQQAHTAAARAHRRPVQ